ncbi:MAG TPA: MEDS domain-containing protein [Nitrososphaeraceae archaeon]|nr:MEDS domain-containing protein [Nitrososphaeraceae archaeon]
MDTLHTHIIGFPHYASSKSNNNNEKKKQEIEAEPDPSIYKPLYQMSNKYLENGYGVLYAAESLPNERDKAKVTESIQNASNTDDVENNISKGLLRVIDSETVYKDNTGGRDIVDFLLSKVSQMQRNLRQEKTKGVVIFNAPDPYFGRSKYDTFMDFEVEMTRALPNNVGILCWYKRDWLNKLSLSHVITVLADHKYTIHSDWEHKQWNTNKIIDVVSKGIDKNLGEGSSILLFQTLKSAYKLNQDSIVQSAARFEETIKKLLGKDDAESVIKSIFGEIIKEVEFSLNGNSSNE